MFQPAIALQRDGGAKRRLNMKSMRIGAVLRLSLLAVVVFARSSAAQTQGSTWGDYRISEPKTYKNLTIFLIQGKDTLPASVPLTLEEALKQKMVIVHETGNVNELAIENVSKDADVFVQSGDIVKGGK